jgi:hypothetical protein
VPSDQAVRDALTCIEQGTSGYGPASIPSIGAARPYRMSLLVDLPSSEISFYRANLPFTGNSM